MTNWHDSPLMIVKSANPSKHDGASLKKMLVEMEALLANGGYALKSVTECNGQIFVFLINEAELKKIQKKNGYKNNIIKNLLIFYLYFIVFETDQVLFFMKKCSHITVLRILADVLKIKQVTKNSSPSPTS